MRKTRPRHPAGPAGRVLLSPLTADDLTVVAPWFRDPATRRYLGGPDWPARMLALGADAVGREFRGAVQSGAYRYLAREDGAPFGYVDCGTFVAPGSDGPTGSIAFAVDPQARGRGLGRAMLAALVRAPELASVAVFEAGVEPENVASRRCLEAARFALAADEPDAEGILYYRLHCR